MSNSSGSSSCLGNLFSLALIGGILFGLVRCSVSIGGFTIGVNAGRQQPEVVDTTDLEGKKKAAEAAVEQFHTQLSQGKCQNIYEQANEKFKHQISQADLLKKCEEVTHQLGAVKSSQQVFWDWQPTEHSSGKYIRIQYNTNFSNSPTRETFIWLVDGSKTELVSYYIEPVVSGQSI